MLEVQRNLFVVVSSWWSSPLRGVAFFVSIEFISFRVGLFLEGEQAWMPKQQ